MTITKRDAFYIVATFYFLFVGSKQELIPSNLMFCRRVFDIWPEIEKQFPDLSEIC